MAVKPEIRVEGLKELRRALKAAEESAPKALQQANKAAAALVVERARERAQETRMNVAGRPTRLGSRGVASIRATAGQASAAVVMGGAAVPYAQGHEWGARRYRQFPPTNREGYILYPSVKELRERIIEVYRDQLGDLVDRYLKG